MTAEEVYAVLRKRIGSMEAGAESVDVDGTALVIHYADGRDARIDFPEPDDGVSISGAKISRDGALIFTLSDGSSTEPLHLPLLNVGTVGETNQHGSVIGESGCEVAYTVDCRSHYGVPIIVLRAKASCTGTISAGESVQLCKIGYRPVWEVVSNMPDGLAYRVDESGNVYLANLGVDPVVLDGREIDACIVFDYQDR